MRKICSASELTTTNIAVNDMVLDQMAAQPLQLNVQPLRRNEDTMKQNELLVITGQRRNEDTLKQNELLAITGQQADNIVLIEEGERIQEGLHEDAKRSDNSVSQTLFDEQFPPLIAGRSKKLMRNFENAHGGKRQEERTGEGLPRKGELGNLNGNNIEHPRTLGETEGRPKP